MCLVAKVIVSIVLSGRWVVVLVVVVMAAGVASGGGGDDSVSSC